MDNSNPVETGENRNAPKKKLKKPYTKPAFKFERVFETQALSCGKIASHGTICRTSPKAS